MLPRDKRLGILVRPRPSVKRQNPKCRTCRKVIRKAQRSEQAPDNSGWNHIECGQAIRDHVKELQR